MSEEKRGSVDYREARRQRFSAMIAAEKKKIEEKVLAETPKPPTSVGDQFFDMINRAIEYGDRSVRVLHINDKPWFRGKDVAAILEYRDIRQALQLHVPLKHKRNYGQLFDSFANVSATPKLAFGEDSRTVYISEAGLTRLVMKSQKAAAVAFQDWVTDELLPSLRLQRTKEMGEWKEYYEKCLEQQKTSISNLISLYEGMDIMHKLYGEKQIHTTLRSIRYTGTTELYRAPTSSSWSSSRTSSRTTRTTTSTCSS